MDDRLLEIEREITKAVTHYGWANEIDNLRNIVYFRVPEMLKLLHIAREDVYRWKIVVYVFAIVAGLGWGLYISTLLGG